MSGVAAGLGVTPFWYCFGMPKKTPKKTNAKKVVKKVIQKLTRPAAIDRTDSRLDQINAKCDLLNDRLEDLYSLIKSEQESVRAVSETKATLEWDGLPAVEPINVQDGEDDDLIDDSDLADVEDMLAADEAEGADLVSDDDVL